MYLHVTLEEHDVLGRRWRTEVYEGVLAASVAGSQHFHLLRRPGHTRFLESKTVRTKVIKHTVRESRWKKLWR